MRLGYSSGVILRKPTVMFLDRLRRAAAVVAVLLVVVQGMLPLHDILAQHSFDEVCALCALGDRQDHGLAPVIPILFTQPESIARPTVSAAAARSGPQSPLARDPPRSC